MTTPFDSSTVLYRLTPSEEERSWRGINPQEFASEYVVVRNAANFSGLECWSLRDGRWSDLFDQRPILAHLLTDHDRLSRLLSLHRRFHGKVACPEGQSCDVCREEDPAYAK